MTTITPIPTPVPTSTDPVNFDVRADAFLAALPLFGTEINSVASEVNALASTATTQAGIATTQAGIATTQAGIAGVHASDAYTSLLAVNAGLLYLNWVSGNTYPVGSVVISPLTRYAYRRIANGATVSTTDPSLDTANWTLANTTDLQLISVTGTSVTAVAGGRYQLVNVAASTVTLPLVPYIGQVIGILVSNGRVDNVIARNTHLIMGLAEDLTLNSKYASVAVVYTGATFGWAIHKFDTSEDSSAASISAEIAKFKAQRLSPYSLIAEAVRYTFGSNMLPPPLRERPYDSTGTIYYIDPVSGSNANNGTTHTTPYLTHTPITWAPGITVLIKAGTTYTLANIFHITAVGTLANPIIIGVYNPFDGSRISGANGAATINCNNAFVSTIYAPSGGCICIDSLALRNNGNTTFGLFHLQLGQYSQIISCDLYNSNGRGTWIMTSVGTVFQDCNFYDCPGDAAIYFDMDNTSYSNSTKVLYCNFYRVNNGVYAIGYGVANTHTFSGEIAGCTFSDCLTPDGGVSQFNAVQILCTGGSPKVYRNKVQGFRNGITYTTFQSTTLGNFTGTVIENNDIKWCMFGIGGGDCYGTSYIQYNRISECGTYDGNNGYASDSYFGRGIELYGSSLARSIRDVVVRYNYVELTANLIPAPNDGSEGVGIGLDNNCRNAQCYGNYLVDNRGNGIQCNSNFNNAIFGNICVNNASFDTRTNIATTFSYEEQKGQIFIINCYDIYVFNNTCISYSGQPYQKYGIAFSSLFPCFRTKVYNNLIINASAAGLQLDSGCTEEYNVIVNSPVLVRDSGTLATRTPGTNTISSTISNLKVEAPFYRPAIGSVCDRTGRRPIISGVSFDGHSLAHMPPIGALHPGIF
jgi:hypothetical protein